MADSELYSGLYSESYRAGYIGLIILAALITHGMFKFVRILDHPNPRSSHNKTIPKCGGIAFVATFLTGMAFIGFAAPDLIRQSYIAGFIFSAIFIAVVSFIDDVREQSAQFKLVTHIAAVAVALYCGVAIDAASFPGADFMPSAIAYLPIIGYLLSFFWILGLTNACNFMDGIDGLVASTTIIAGLFFIDISNSAGGAFVSIAAYTITAGATGFLYYNAPPARIFMGDVGSVFIGFVFATLAIIAARYEHSPIPFLVMPLLLFHFIFDTLFTFFRRIINRRNPLRAHRTHLYQLAMRSGLSHLQVTLMLSTMALLQGIGALYMVNLAARQQPLMFVPFLLIQFAYAALILRRAKKRGVNLNDDN